MLTLQKLWAVQWVWLITAYAFILYSEIRTNLSYGHPLIPRRLDKRALTVKVIGCCLATRYFYLYGYLYLMTPTLRYRSTELLWYTCCMCNAECCMQTCTFYMLHIQGIGGQDWAMGRGTRAHVMTTPIERTEPHPTL